MKQMFCKLRLVLVGTMLACLCAMPVSGLAAQDHETTAQSANSAEESDSINWFDFGANKPVPLVALFLNFAVLVAVVYIIMRGPIRRRLHGRVETLQAALSAAREATARAEHAMAEARAQSAALAAELDRIRTQAIEGEKAEKQRVAKDSAARIERMRADAASMIEQEIARMVQTVREEVAHEVIALATELVRKRLDSADHDRLAREYLAEMGGSLSPGGSVPPSAVP